MALPGTDEASLTEVMISRSNQELAEIRNFFIDCKSQEHKKYILVNIKFILLTTDYGHTLVSEIEGDTSGPYEQLLIQMAEVMPAFKIYSDLKIFNFFLSTLGKKRRDKIGECDRSSKRRR